MSQLTSRAVCLFQAALLTSALALSVAACDDTPSSAAAPKIPLTKPERITKVARILKHIPPPSLILDAHFDEIALGSERGIGPTDYVSYMYVRVAPDEIGKWIALFRDKRDYAVDYKAPDKGYDWWVSAETFKTLEFFEPAPYSSRNGWAGVSRATGEIWIFDFTT